MKTKNIVTCVGALCACLAIASPAVAQDNCGGYSIGVGDARVVIHNDRTLPQHLASGVCTATGATTGKCSYKDKDGDEYTTVNEWVSGSPDGKWRTVSGTGKYAKAGNYGWWKWVGGDPLNVWAFGGYCTQAEKTK